MNNILSVSEVNRYIKELISRDFILSGLWIKGEISNYKAHYSGHMYFTLKDEASLIKCVMFKTYTAGLRFQPENGMKVLIRGNVSVFERDGQYQLYAEEMQPDGLGNLHLAFEQLKQKLSSEGLFDERHKKKIPLLPRTIGVVTSSTGAVLRDILHILGRRYANTHVKIYPVAVQGELAPGQISHAIAKINETRCADVIIVARGGGSLEELWAFNEEVVARSIFASQIPVISAVGHETDYTIADFVADLRAPTPSAAAELVMPEKALMEDRIEKMTARLYRALKNYAKLNRTRYEKLAHSIVFKQPFDRIYQERMRLDLLDKYAHRAVLENIHRIRSDFGLLAGKLDALSPLSILSRGYSVVKSKDGAGSIKNAAALKQGEEIEIRFRDGKADCMVNHIHITREE